MNPPVRSNKCHVIQDAQTDLVFEPSPKKRPKCEVVDQGRRLYECAICAESTDDQFLFFEHLKTHYEAVATSSSVLKEADVVGGRRQESETEQQTDKVEIKPYGFPQLKVENVESAILSPAEGGNTEQMITETVGLTPKKREARPVVTSEQLKGDTKNNVLIPKLVARKAGGQEGKPQPVLSCPYCRKVFRKSSNYQMHIECCVKIPNDDDRTHQVLLGNVNEVEQGPRNFKPSTVTPAKGSKLVVEFTSKNVDDVAGDTDDYHPPFTEDDFDDEETELMYLEGNICPSCDEHCETKENLEGHIRTLHPELLAFDERKDSKKASPGSAAAKKADVLKCHQCHRMFNHRNSLVYHMRSHTGERPYKCDTCGKCFFATSALKVHTRLHSGEKPYRCQYCDRDFRQWGDLKYHIISIHSDVRQYQCEFCGKDFARKYSLVVHRRIHTGERNYKCDFCGKCFRAASYMANHRKIHTGEKPHACSICNKSFRVRSDMKRHMASHNKDYLKAPDRNESQIQTLPTISEPTTGASSGDVTVKTQLELHNAAPPIGSHTVKPVPVCLPIPVVSQSNPAIISGDILQSLSIALVEGVQVTTANVLQPACLTTSTQQPAIAQEGMTIAIQGYGVQLRDTHEPS